MSQSCVPSAHSSTLAVQPAPFASPKCVSGHTQSNVLESIDTQVSIGSPRLSVVGQVCPRMKLNLEFSYVTKVKYAFWLVLLVYFEVLS